MQYIFCLKNGVENIWKLFNTYIKIVRNDEKLFLICTLLEPKNSFEVAKNKTYFRAMIRLHKRKTKEVSP